MARKKARQIEIPTPERANDRQVGGEHYHTEQVIQHWDYVEANDLPYLEAMAIKYVGRHADKDGLEDLDKAIHFIEKIKERYDD